MNRIIAIISCGQKFAQLITQWPVTSRLFVAVVLILCAGTKSARGTVWIVHEYNFGLLPVVQCFSCMSKSLQDDFQYLSRLYLPQQTFDDRCNEPFMDKSMPVVNCSNICVTLKESEQTFGVVFGYNYIRGCIDKIFVNGFLNKTAMETHRFYFDDVCKALPWEQLMTTDFAKKPSNNQNNNYKSGDVILCSCYGNRCNGANSARNLGQMSICRTLTTISLLLIVTFNVIFRF